MEWRGERPLSQMVDQSCLKGVILHIHLAALVASCAITPDEASHAQDDGQVTEVEVVVVEPDRGIHRAVVRQAGGSDLRALRTSNDLVEELQELATPRGLRDVDIHEAGREVGQRDDAERVREDL